MERMFLMARRAETRTRHDSESSTPASQIGESGSQRPLPIPLLGIAIVLASMYSATCYISRCCIGCVARYRILRRLYRLPMTQNDYIIVKR